MTITVLANRDTDPKWEIWVHLNPKDDPRTTGESFIIGDGPTQDTALAAARATLSEASAALEELMQ